MNSSPSLSESTQVVGRYLVQSELGRGSAGRVYLALDPNIGRQVAIKVFHPAGMSEDDAEEFRGRFVNEARASGVLSHPGIVTTYDAGYDAASGSLFITSEYLDGGTLRDRIRSGPMHAAEVGRLGLELAGALQHAHRRGILHRDLKPANILFSSEGIAKLADFGIAKIAGLDQTVAGTVVGTPSYMSPEQITGGEVDERSDLFSLGVLLTECLCGVNPFASDRLATTTFRIVHGEVAEYRVPAGAEGMDAVLRKAMSRRPADRYPSADKFVEALRNALRQSSRTASGLRLPQRTTTTASTSEAEGITAVTRVGWIRRVRIARWPILAATLLVLILALAAHWSSDETEADRASGVPTSDESPSSTTNGDGPAAVPESRVEEPAALADLPAELSTATSATTLEGSGRTSEPAVASDSSATLELRYRNRLKQGWITLWVDQERAWSKRLAAESAKTRWLGETLDAEIAVPAGTRTIEIRITGGSNFDASTIVEKKFSPGGRYPLEVEIRRRANRVSLRFD